MSQKQVRPGTNKHRVVVAKRLQSREQVTGDDNSPCPPEPGIKSVERHLIDGNSYSNMVGKERKGPTSRSGSTPPNPRKQILSIASYPGRMRDLVRGTKFASFNNRRFLITIGFLSVGRRERSWLDGVRLYQLNKISYDTCVSTQVHYCS